MAHSEFEALLAEKADLESFLAIDPQDSDGCRTDLWHRTIGDQCRELYAEKFPRRKWDWTKFRMEFPGYEKALFEFWKAQFVERRKEETTRLESVTDRLALLAPECEVPHTPGLERMLRCVSESSYSSQGYGARKYAEVEAGWLIANCPVPARILTDDMHWESGGRHHYLARFKVMVETDELGIEMLLRRPVSLREWVSYTWKNGANPRVYNPWLKDGYEESVGLDYFGGER